MPSSLEFPPSSSSSSFSFSTCEFHPPSIEAWISAVIVHGGLTVLLGIPIGTILYYYSTVVSTPSSTTTTISTTNNNITNIKNNNTWKRPIIPLFFGTGSAILMYFLRFDTTTTTNNNNNNNGSFLIMLWLLFSKHRWMSTFLASTFGFTTFFKCLAVALHQQPPETILTKTTTNNNNNDSFNNNNNNSSFTTFINFLHWFVAFPEPVFAKGKSRQTTNMEIWNRTKYFLYKIFGLFVLMTIFQNTTIVVSLSSFDKDKNNNNDNKDDAMRSPSLLKLLLRGYLYIWFIYLWASFCLDFSTLAMTIVTRKSTQIGFRNPLLESRCLREAWGTRWNLPVHVLLKRSVYIPCRKSGCNRLVASFVTFVVSGLLHEYNFSVHNQPFYEPGKATIFFVLMGGIVLLEDWFYTTIAPKILPSWVAKIPSFIISTIYIWIVAAAPVEPFFIKSWIQAGFMDAVSELLPYIKCK